MPRHFVSLRHSGVMPFRGAGSELSASAMAESTQPGIGLLTCTTALEALLGGNACTVVPPRKAKARTIIIKQRSGRFHMTPDIVLPDAKRNTVPG